MPNRYHTTTIFLHWVMAIAFFLMLLSGLTMEDISDKALRFNVYQWHKSLGVILLGAFFLRVAMRFLFKAPDLPESFPKLEKIGAKAGHIALYALMLAVPLSGWVMVSSSVYGLPTVVFGAFEWPHIPGIAANAGISDMAEDVHEILANTLIAVIVLHVAAVIKHKIFDKYNLLKRIWF